MNKKQMEELIEELEGVDIGDFREVIAREDADRDLVDFLIDHFDLESESYDEEEEANCDMDDEEYEDDDDDNYYSSNDEDDDEYYDEDDDDEDELPNLSSEELSIAEAIVADIKKGSYPLSAIQGLYNSNIIDYISIKVR